MCHHYRNALHVLIVISSWVKCCSSWTGAGSLKLSSSAFAFPYNLDLHLVHRSRSLSGSPCRIHCSHSPIPYFKLYPLGGLVSSWASSWLWYKGVMLCLPKQGTTVAPKRTFISCASGCCTRDCSLCGLYHSTSPAWLDLPGTGVPAACIPWWLRQWGLFHWKWSREDRKEDLTRVVSSICACGKVWSGGNN